MGIPRQSQGTRESPFYLCREWLFFNIHKWGILQILTHILAIVTNILFLSGKISQSSPEFAQLLKGVSYNLSIGNWGNLRPGHNPPISKQKQPPNLEVVNFYF